MRRRELASFWVSLTFGVIAVLMVLGWAAINTAMEGIAKAELTDNEPLVIHMHVTLKILVNGQHVTVSEGIGIYPELYKSHDLDKYGIKNPRTYPLHTHDVSGVIHIESTVIRTFTFGQFFDVWGETFDEKCIMDRCNNNLNKVRMYVDGIENFEFREHVLKNGEVIIIEYGYPEGESQF